MECHCTATTFMFLGRGGRSLNVIHTPLNLAFQVPANEPLVLNEPFLRLATPIKKCDPLALPRKGYSEGKVIPQAPPLKYRPVEIPLTYLKYLLEKIDSLKNIFSNNKTRKVNALFNGALSSTLYLLESNRAKYWWNSDP